MNDSQPLAEATEIYQKLEERAISDSNDLNRRIVACRNCRRAPGFLPVVGSGHPLADIMLVKHQPHYLEVNEGVSFYGRSGSAIIKSMERLSVNPLVVYGTNIVKCHDVRPIDGEKNCPLFWLEEFNIAHPRIIVVMGRRTLQIVNKTRVAGMKKLAWDPGVLQSFTPFCKALVTPDIDECLDDDQDKAEFWKAFRSLGEWFQNEPPY
jgi:uracil-DNA glycosylase family 4